MQKMPGRTFWQSAVCLMLTACGGPGDLPAAADTHPSLGAQIYEVVCHRVAFSDNPNDLTGESTQALCRSGVPSPSGMGPALTALDGHRQQFIAAIDTAIDRDLAPALQTFLTAILPLYDDGTMQAQLVAGIRATRALIASADLHRLLERRARQPDLKNQGASPMQTVCRYEGLAHLAAAWLDTPAAQMSEPWLWLLHSLADGCQQQASASGPRDANFAKSVAAVLLGPAPAWVDVATTASYDGPPAFFSAAAPLEQTYLAAVVAQWRSLHGAVPDAALLLAQIATAGAGPLVPRQHTFADGTQAHFAGFDLARSPYGDLAGGLTQLGQSRFLPRAVAHVQTLWRAAEAPLASLVALGLDAAKWPEAKTDAALRPGAVHTPWQEDFLEIGAQIAAEPELLEDIIAALAHPKTAALGSRLAEQLRMRDRIDFNLDDVNGALSGDFITPVDRTTGDVADNQSIFQRLLHLVHDASGQRICSNALDFEPGYAPCELFKIDDAAIFYVRAMLGTATLTLRVKHDDVFIPSQLQGASLEDGNKEHSEIESFSGLEGFIQIDAADSDAIDDAAHGALGPPHAQYRSFRVTPKAAARLLFSMYDRRIAPTSAYGETRAGLQMLAPRLRIGAAAFDEVHWGTLFAWEKNDFFTAIGPLLQAFGAHGREDLLVRLVCVLHTHWPSQKSSTTQNADAARWDYAQQSGLSRFEPLLARLLDAADGDLLGRLGALVTASLTPPGDPAAGGHRALAAFVRDALLGSHGSHVDTPQPTAAASMSPQPAPAVRLARGLQALTHNIAATAPAAQAAQRLFGEVLQQALQTEGARDQSRFVNRQAHGLIAASLQLAAQWAQTTGAAADQMAPGAWDAATPAFWASLPLQLGLQLGAQMANDPVLVAELGRLGDYLLGPASRSTLRASCLALQAAQAADSLQPLVAQAATWLLPETGLVSHGMHLLRALHERGAAQPLFRLLYGLTADLDGTTPLATLLHIFAQVNRQTPGSDAALTAADFKRLLEVAGDLLENSEHGLMRFVQLVAHRRDGAASAF